MDMFLQELEATAIYFDMKRFGVIAAQLGPVELGIALSRYYDHCSAPVEKHGGRVVKFMGDAVLGAFLAGGASDHRAEAAAALAELAAGKPAWLADNASRSLPVMEYTVGVATGSVLAGDVGTSRLRFFDILGEPVKLAQQLSRLATTRNVGHLVAASTFDPIKASVKGVEVEPAEFGSRRFRLYRLEV